MNLQELKERLAKFASDLPELRLVYLFGSQVTGQIGPQSDYDLGILVARGSDTIERRAAWEHALAVLLAAERLDVVWLSQAPVELAFGVISQGRLLYERDLTARVEYEARVMSRYGDYLPVLRAQRIEILAGGDHAARVQRYREALRRTERTLGEIKAAQGKK